MSTLSHLSLPRLDFRVKSDCGVLVMGTSYTGLGLVRGLGRHGIPIWVLGKRLSLAGASRYARRTLPWPDGPEEQQVDYLIGLARQYDLYGWALFPDGDNGAAFIARHYEELNKYFRLTVPTWDVLQKAYNKRLTYALAAKVGVAYPWTCCPSRSDVEKLDCQFPLVLKPAHHQGHDLFSIGRGWQVFNRQELLARYDEACSLVDPSVVLIQEMIPGGGETQFSFAALCHAGNVLASVSAQRKRLLPADFGTSAYIETVDKPEIEVPAKRWLAKANFTGLVEMDFKFDARDGLYKLLDVNARAWGWHALGPRAGVDFAFLMWQLAQGNPITPARGRAGVRWVRTAYDLMAALQAMRHGTLSLRDYARSLKGAQHEMYALDDFMPALVEVPLLMHLTWIRISSI